MKKKIFASIMCALMLVSTAVPAFAAEAPVNGVNYELADRAILSDGLTRASWGEGNLYTSDPLFSNPQGYAETTTFAGTAYKITAKIIVKDNNDETYDSGTTTETNSDTATSGSIVSKTARCDFTGDHRIRDTSSSSWQYATTSKSY